LEPLYTPEGALPPTDVRFLDVHVEPWPDSRRVRVHVRLTPFQQPPSLRASITAQDGEMAAMAHIIETIQHQIVFTMHIRGAVSDQPYTLSVELYYTDTGNVDQQVISFSLPPLPASES
jgi:hypothetical protein